MRNRPVEEIIREIKIQQKQEKRLADRSITCKKHNCEKIYFCEHPSCEVDVCPDCYIESHLGHKKRASLWRNKSIADIFEKIEEPVERRLRQLKLQRREADYDAQTANFMRTYTI